MIQFFNELNFAFGSELTKKNFGVFNRVSFLVIIDFQEINYKLSVGGALWFYSRIETVPATSTCSAQ